MSKYLKLISVLVIIISALTFNLYCGEIIGKIIPLTGNPKFGGIVPRKIIKVTPLKNGDIIKTGSDSSAQVIYTDGSKILIKPVSTVIFKKNRVSIKRGNSVLRFVKKNKKFQIFTPVVLMGLLGTELEVSVPEKNTSLITLNKGKIWLKALLGNKKKLELSHGHKITVTEKGILEEPVQTEVFIKTSSNPPVNITPSEEVSNEENLEMNGNYLFKIMPHVLNIPYRLNIDGYSKYNGDDLQFEFPKPYTFNNLEEGTYEVTITTNGIDSTFPIVVTPDKPKQKKIITYVLKAIQPSICGLSDTSNSEERLKYLKFTMIHNGKRTPIHYVDSNKKEHFGSDVYLQGISFLMGNVFFIPEDLDEYPEVEVEYTGTLPVKMKKTTVKFNKQDKLYKVDF